MLVKLKTCMCGPNGSYQIGDEVEDNGDLVKGGYAEPLEKEKPFVNLPMEKAFEILKDGTKGEIEVLKQIGVDVEKIVKEKPPRKGR